MRRLAALLAVAVGLTLIGFVVVEHLFSRSADAQTIADRYRPLLSSPGLAGLRAGFDELRKAGAELHDEALPRLQASLGLDDATFATYLGGHLPGIRAFERQAPGIVALVDPVIGKMEAIRADYRRADAIPVDFLDLESAPWLFLGIGALLVAVGVYALVRPGLAAGIAVTVVGLGVALAPVVLGIPGKVDAAVRVTAVGRIGLAPATGARAVAATRLFDAMVHDVRTGLEPALTDQLAEGDAAGRRVFESSFPALTRFTRDWDRSLSVQSHALSDSQVALAATFANADRIPLEPIPWMFIGSGAVLAAVGAAALVPGVRRRPAGVAVSPLPAG
ncbi:MAG TPA: hypothetical protein VFC99_01345 [Acidimicrobiia bacterium]|nr:hypothetical protein [Acidimicrobiia bacterium]